MHILVRSTYSIVMAICLPKFEILLIEALLINVNDPNNLDEPGKM